MRTHIIEVTNGEQNWGKFLLGQFEAAEWQRKSEVDPGSYLLRAIGWAPDVHVLVLDLQTGEGAMFRPGGQAKADLDKHRVWVCPMFGPFLEWLYKNWSGELRADIANLPTHLDLPDAPFAMYGYRRNGM